MLSPSKKKPAVVLQQKLHYISKQLRNKPTAAENLLWQKLKGKQLCGKKFRRQYPLYSYIADFYCHDKKLLIEVDGEIHKQQQTKDTNRDQMLHEYGYYTLRFTNADILNNINSVLTIITKNL
ncbi:MAG: endonuclease domain-containing protein [Patescibacteria group bacterium]|jgi:very-short-patch-repair endonuclease